MKHTYYWYVCVYANMFMCSHRCACTQVMYVPPLFLHSYIALGVNDVAPIFLLISLNNYSDKLFTDMDSRFMEFFEMPL